MQHDVAANAPPNNNALALEGKDMSGIGSGQNSKGDHLGALLIVQDDENVEEGKREQSNRDHDMEKDPPLLAHLSLRERSSAYSRRDCRRRGRGGERIDPSCYCPAHDHQEEQDKGKRSDTIAKMQM